MWGQIAFINSIRPTIYSITIFHEKGIVVVVLIATYVLVLTAWFRTLRFTVTTSRECHDSESAWTIIPALILLSLALPSLRILYLLEEVADPSLTVKVTGHQWYWTYDYADTDYLWFESYIIPTNELSVGDIRLLEVDRRLVIPSQVSVRLLITAADVLHSWRLPAAGIKIDAIPGRLNQSDLIRFVPGVYYGQCSEICGANHRFIPIGVEVIPYYDWVEWFLDYACACRLSKPSTFRVDIYSIYEHFLYSIIEYASLPRRRIKVLIKSELVYL